MPKPNYAFEKRQRDLAKKKKKEEKLVERKQRKAAGELGAPADGEAPDSTADAALGSEVQPQSENGVQPG